MSPTHLALGVAAVKSRLSRSGNFGAVLSCRVSPLRRRIRRATRPWRRIESATVFSDTVQPASRRSCMQARGTMQATGLLERHRHSPVDGVATPIPRRGQTTDRGRIEGGVDASAGSVADAYDSAMAESQTGLYKAELIRPEGPCRDVEHV